MNYEFARGWRHTTMIRLQQNAILFSTEIMKFLFFKLTVKWEETEEKKRFTSTPPSSFSMNKSAIACDRAVNK